MGEIAHRAGLAKRTVFRHFASKEDLIAAIMLQMLDQLICTAERLTEAEDPAAALTEFMTSGVEAPVADRTFCDVIGTDIVLLLAGNWGVQRSRDLREGSWSSTTTGYAPSPRSSRAAPWSRPSPSTSTK